MKNLASVEVAMASVLPTHVVSMIQRNLRSISDHLPLFLGLRVVAFASGKLIVVSIVLCCLDVVLALLSVDIDAGAAKETVLHLPEGSTTDSSAGGGGMILDIIVLCTRSVAYVDSKLGAGTHSVTMVDTFPVI